MAESRRKGATYGDIARYPEGERVEIIAGEISVTPRSRAAHGVVQSGLSWAVGGRFHFTDDPGGWWIVVEPEVALAPHEVYIPDLAGWRRERVPILPDDVPLAIVPDWVCEVTSPATARDDRLRKADGYLAGGVPFYWLVDIDARLIEALAAREGAWVRLGAWGEEARARIPPFDAVELDLTRLFPPPAA